MYSFRLAWAVARLAVDDADRRLIEALRHDGRASLKQLAAQTGLRPTTVYNRMRKLAKSGVIERFTIQVNPEAVGESFVAFVLVSGLPERFTDDWLLRNRNVAEVYGVTGEYDLLMKLRFGGKEQFNEFIMNFRDRYKRSITRTVSMIETTTIKRD